MGSITIGIPGFKNSGILKKIILTAVYAVLLFAILDLFFPMDLDPRSKTRIIVANNGTPLRSFPDAKGVWRYPVTLDEVSPFYIEALIGYEDRWFYKHPGFNPYSLVRAAFQWAKSGRVISGGSTLTMQVARLKRPMERNVTGKLIQIFSAIQLELHFSKDEILNYYLNHAPFGGTFEGVQSASYEYFDHSAKILTRAQAALLAVMPQAPSRFRPDRYPKRAEKARNKLLDRLCDNGIWTRKEVESAKLEKVTGWPVESRIKAPILSRRLHKKLPREKNRIETFINYPVQITIEQMAEDYAANLPPHLSVATMVMNNKTGAVEAYLGSADFFNLFRFGHVDMVRAKRSPGSTMKPFIYGIALDQGLIHSQSLLMDVPVKFGDYKPVNFHRSFNGPVSVSYALSQSLNLPAVQLLDHINPRFFYSKLVNTDFEIKLPKNAKPNLSMALGGFSTNLENLVYLYSALGRGGKTIKPRFTKEDKTFSYNLLSEGAAWIIHSILLPEKSHIITSEKNFAIKTGTSYGFRDAWAIGVSKGYTVGVWVGRPDGLPVPGHYGAQTAVPLLNRVCQILPKHEYKLVKPSSVSDVKICWPTGQLMKKYNKKDSFSCENPKGAWILNNTVPRTLPALKESLDPPVIELMLKITKNGKYRIPNGCSIKEKSYEKKITLWPRRLESWLPYYMRREKLIPPLHPSCRDAKDILIEETVSIMGLEDGEKIRKKTGQNIYPSIDLKVLGGNGPWYWFINSKLKGEGKTSLFSPEIPGKYQIIVIDQSGIMDMINVEVE